MSNINEVEASVLRELEKLTGRLPETKTKGGHIILLDIRGNQLKELPESIGTLSNLQELNIGDNQLKELPESIGNLSNLQTLFLFNNQLKELPESIGNLSNLQKLYIGSNQLKELPEFIGNLSNLQELNITNNQFKKELYIRGNQLKELPESIGTLSNLQKLLIDKNYLSTLPNTLSNLKLLDSLHLRDNKFRKIPESIWPLNKLQELKLERNLLEGESKEIIDSKRDILYIREFCRERASIKIFLSHKMAESEVLQIEQIAEYLEQKDEIYKVYHCERDTLGGIREFMEQSVLNSNLLVFFASEQSLDDSEHCQNELKLARSKGIRIIPIITEPKKMDYERLTNFSKDIELGFDLGNEIGFRYRGRNYNVFCDKLYDYILKYKSKFNLFKPAY